MFKPCAMRSKLTIMSKDGTKEIVFRCSHPAAPVFGTNVDPATCDGCLVIVEPRQPVTADGFLACDFRKELPIVPACCGAPNVKRLCDSPDSAYNGRELTPSICRSCPVRRSKN